MFQSPKAIRRTLQTGRFIPYFQPLVMIRTGKLIGFEALARWKHPEIGILSPESGGGKAAAARTGRGRS